MPACHRRETDPTHETRFQHATASLQLLVGRWTIELSFVKLLFAFSIVGGSYDPNPQS